MSDHPFVVALGVLASIATIFGLLVSLDVIDLGGGSTRTPVVQSSGGSGEAGDDFSFDRPCVDPSLSLTQGSGSSGTQVSVSGSGFPADEQVDLRFHTEALTPARTDGSGEFTVTVVVPGTFDAFAPQQFELTATTSPSVCSSRVAFDLLAG